MDSERDRLAGMTSQEVTMLGEALVSEIDRGPRSKDNHLTTIRSALRHGHETQPGNQLYAKALASLEAIEAAVNAQDVVYRMLAEGDRNR